MSPPPIRHPLARCLMAAASVTPGQVVAARRKLRRQRDPRLHPHPHQRVPLRLQLRPLRRPARERQQPNGRFGSRSRRHPVLHQQRRPARPSTSPASPASARPTFYATNEYENVYQILDNVTKVARQSHLKGWRQYPAHPLLHLAAHATPRQPTTSTASTPARQGTPNTGSGVADFLTNNMNSAAISNVFTSDDVRYNRAGYAQDDWKATQRLTLNYGLRYDYSTPYLERHDNQAAFIPTSAPSPAAAPASTASPRQQASVLQQHQSRQVFSRLLALDQHHRSVHRQPLPRRATEEQLRAPRRLRLQSDRESRHPRWLRHLLRRSGKHRLLSQPRRELPV